jgi:ornithine cyclodeaminase
MVAAEAELRLLRRRDVLQCIGPLEVLDAVRSALVAVAQGGVASPGPMSFDFRRARGEAHVKGAWIERANDWSVKVSTGFYDNPAQGLPSSWGLSLVASAETGLVHTIVADGGYLTDVRTGAAGALAAMALTPSDIRRVAMIGTGTQARVQLEYLVEVRQVDHIVAFGRNRERAGRYAAEMRKRLGIEVEVADSVAAALRNAELVITATPAERPLIQAESVTGPTAFVAVGADMPAKQELDAALLERADTLVADDPGQAARVGELHHATRAASRAGWLGHLLAEPGTEHTAGLRIADLTGLGAEDAAVASLVARRARELQLGEQIEVG